MHKSETVEGLSKYEFKELVFLAFKDSHFIFDGTLYKKVEGVAMGFPVGPPVANAFFVYQKENWREHCPFKYRPFYCRRYFDGTFALFNSP